MKLYLSFLLIAFAAALGDGVAALRRSNRVLLKALKALTTEQKVGDTCGLRSNCYDCLWDYDCTWYIGDDQADGTVCYYNSGRCMAADTDLDWTNVDWDKRAKFEITADTSCGLTAPEWGPFCTDVGPGLPEDSCKVRSEDDENVFVQCDGCVEDWRGEKYCE